MLEGFVSGVYIGAMAQLIWGWSISFWMVVGSWIVLSTVADVIDSAIANRMRGVKT